MKASWSIVVACLSVAGSGTVHVAAAPVKRAPITIAMTGLNCNTDLGAGTFEARSWSWGASVATTAGGSGGSGSGKAQLEALALTRVSDACSPALVSALVKGDHFQKLTLSQYDSNGELKATVVLEEVMLSEWHIGGNSTSAEPTEELAVQFAKFTFMDATSSNKVCYDVAQQKAC